MNELSHEEASSPVDNPGLVHTCNPNIWKVEVGRLWVQSSLGIELMSPLSLPLSSLWEAFCGINFCSFSEGTWTMICIGLSLSEYQSDSTVQFRAPWTWVSCVFLLSPNTELGSVTFYSPISWWITYQDNHLHMLWLTFPCLTRVFQCCTVDNSNTLSKHLVLCASPPLRDKMRFTSVCSLAYSIERSLQNTHLLLMNLGSGSFCLR